VYTLAKVILEVVLRMKFGRMSMLTLQVERLRNRTLDDPTDAALLKGQVPGLLEAVMVAHSMNYCY
jgi:hypothetical protein